MEYFSPLSSVHSKSKVPDTFALNGNAIYGFVDMEGSKSIPKTCLPLNLTKNLLIMKPVLISCIASFLIARAFNEESIYESIKEVYDK